MKTALYASAAVIALAAFGTNAAFAQSRDTIQIAGSSTVLPFSSIVAEEFGAIFPEFNTPVVGSGGTGGGFSQFCQGVGDNTIDIANASRPMRDGEREACNNAGVNDIREIQFGFDGIVFASSANGGDFALTPAHVFKAIAAKVPVDGELVDNPYTSWDQIDPSLPAQPIVLAIPGSNHGTREVFQERVVTPGAEASDLPENLSAEEKSAVETTFRQDVVVEIAGDYTETLARLTADPNTVGVFGLSFYDQNRDILKVATVDGIIPSLETVAAGEYPVSRPLYFYVKGEHIGTVPGLVEFTEYFLSEAMSGNGGILEAAGLIPQPAEVTAEVLSAFQQ
ncbi:substrate-binding domain-containing protein [Devosia sp. YIM 151766]|uniref:substrate-binding domain-containing protein n=1 Tax=Devosia sp. YIM 151766 TaxID=3017325 RepID=UPI00255C67F7|nr:substrate-binding domain-containing protein [Devosia sp. YIM 151766]WIY51780.1 substrate-binding domain-containing protein [Devosia sp. YIM 151766]